VRRKAESLPSMTTINHSDLRANWNKEVVDGTGRGGE